MLLKHKKSQGNKNGGARLLINVYVLGSAGPLRFLVNEEEMVSAVIDTALKSYAREGRLPVLGSDFTDFVLYCPNYATEALRPWETIRSYGVRNFMLCKKPVGMEKAAVSGGEIMEEQRRQGFSWRAWLNKSLRVKISTH